MNARKVSLYKIAAGVAFVVIAATSCKSKNDDAPAPVNPYADMLPYLPSVISDQYNPLDSFVYNKDNTVASMFINYDDGTAYRYRMDFTYDQSGRCTVAKRFEEEKLIETHTIIYDGLKMTDISSYPTNPNAKADTIPYLFDKNNMLVQLASKDTVPSGEGEKTVAFAVLSTEGSNVLSYKNHYFYTRPNGDNPIVDSWDYTTTYSYDTKKNPLQFFFARNPIMGVVLNWGESEMEFTMGKNNVVSFVEKEERPNKETSTYNYTVQNTFEEKTGLLTKIVTTKTANENDVTIYNFSYTPAK